MRPQASILEKFLQQIDFKQRLNWAIVALVMPMISGCVYHFVNSDRLARPTTVRTIAIDSIYDTSYEALSHADLWQEIQKSLAKDGFFIITSQSKADALLRLQLTSSSIGNSSSPKSLDSSDAVDTFDPATVELDKIRKIDRAGQVTERENISIGILAEVYDLRSGKKLFSSNYAGAGEFKSLRGDHLPRESDFIIHEEALNYRLREIARSIGTNIARDLSATL